MSMGFLGIQFGFALQNANASRILQNFGADVEHLSWFWLAAPVTGLIVQPIIGHYSDRTWNRMGRRKPYFLTRGHPLASYRLMFDAQLRCTCFIYPTDVCGSWYVDDHGCLHQYLYGAIQSPGGGYAAQAPSSARRDFPAPGLPSLGWALWLAHFFRTCWQEWGGCVQSGSSWCGSR